MSYLIQNWGRVGLLLLQHLQMTGLGVGIAVLIAVPVALILDQWRWFQLPVLGSLSILYTIPSLALMIVLIPLFGLQPTTVVVAIALYAQVILAQHLTVGLQEIPGTVLEAARGMGMNGWQRWWWVQVPLILPVFLAGVRLAVIVGIGIATIGAKFGAGGLGVLLFEGIAQVGRFDKIWAGTIALVILALGLNAALLTLEQQAKPGAKR